MNQLIGGRLNIFLTRQKVNPRYYADPKTGQTRPWFSRMFSENFLWIQRNGRKFKIR